MQGQPGGLGDGGDGEAVDQVAGADQTGPRGDRGLAGREVDREQLRDAAGDLLQDGETSFTAAAVAQDVKPRQGGHVDAQRADDRQRAVIRRVLDDQAVFVRTASRSRRARCRGWSAARARTLLV